MKRAQAVRRRPSEIAGVHQRRAYRLATTPAQRCSEVIGGLVVAGLAAVAIVAAHYGPALHG